MEQSIRVLLVPGGGGSGPDHWHTYWEADNRNVQRVNQTDWNDGTREDWVTALDEHINISNDPVILVAHSLGCILVSHWAETHRGHVLGALMVAPADIEGPWVPSGSLYERFKPIPLNRFPFATTIVASTNDPYLTPDRAEKFSVSWGSRLEFVGPLEHIGSEARLHNWVEGWHILERLLERVSD